MSTRRSQAGHVGPVMKYAREVKQWTREDLAQALRRATGDDAWTDKRVTNVERGYVHVTLPMAMEVSSVLGVTLDQLAHGLTSRGKGGDTDTIG